jgi:hypothetical protein
LGRAGVFGEKRREQDRRGKKESPAGGVGHVGTKVGVWEEGSIAQNSKAVGSRSDSWWIFLRRRLGALKPDRAPVTDAPARERLLPPIRFGEDFQARPAFEARHVRKPSTFTRPSSIGFLQVGQSGASARNVSSSSMIAQTSKTKTGRDNMKSIAHFAIAATTDVSCCGDHGGCGNHSEQADRIAISISHVARAPALLCRGIAVASMAAAGEEIARRYSMGEGLGEGWCSRMRHEQMQRATLCGRRVRRKTCRHYSKRNQEASHGSLL